MIQFLLFFVHVSVSSFLLFLITAVVSFPDLSYHVPSYTPAPDFLLTPSNVTFHKGELAVLRCSVFNLGTKTVSKSNIIKAHSA